jgi:hypothetical protein
VTTRATRRRVRLALVVLGGVGPVLTSCGGAAPTDENVGRSEPPAASTSPSAGLQVEGDDQEATGSFDDVADPATMSVPAKGMDALDALADVKVWAGSTFTVSDEQVTAGLVREDNSEVVVALQSDQVLAEPSSREEMDYWLEYTQMAERPREVDPVVVDGVEMLRAQGTNGFAFIDHFVRGNGDLTATIDFVLPLDMSKAEREEYVGQVMATVRLAPELR